MAWFLHFSSSSITFTYPISRIHHPSLSRILHSDFCFFSKSIDFAYCNWNGSLFSACLSRESPCCLVFDAHRPAAVCIAEKRAPRRKTFPRYLLSSVRNRCPLSVGVFASVRSSDGHLTWVPNCEKSHKKNHTRARTETRLAARVLILRRNECSCVWTISHLFLLILEQKMQKKFSFECVRMMK